MISNPNGMFLCTWCGEPVEKIQDPEEHPHGNLCGTCDDDGIVYVTTDPEEAGQ